MTKSKVAKARPTSPTEARQPAQERSRQRFSDLLDAARDLLSEGEFDGIGLYDIAAKAKVPPGSVYHFFPTKEAAFVALARRYLDEMRAYIEQPGRRGGGETWGDMITERFDLAVEFYNANLAFRKLFLGGTVVSAIRKEDTDHVASVAEISFRWLDQHFVMPYLPNHNLKFSALIAIHDGIWMTSYARHGVITGEFAEEARRAGLAYCRTFLPDVLPRRPPAN